MTIPMPKMVATFAGLAPAGWFSPLTALPSISPTVQSVSHLPHSSATTSSRKWLTACLPLGEVRQGIENAFKRDGRMKLVEERRLNDLKNKYNYRLDPAFESLLNNTLMAHGRLDSAFVAQYIKGAKTPLFTYGAKQSVPVKALMSQLNTTTTSFPILPMQKKEIMTKVNAMAEQALKDYDAYEAVKNNPEYATC